MLDLSFNRLKSLDGLRVGYVVYIDIHVHIADSMYTCNIKVMARDRCWALLISYRLSCDNLLTHYNVCTIIAQICCALLELHVQHMPCEWV